MSVIRSLLETVPLPRMVTILQRFGADRIEHLENAVYDAFGREQAKLAWPTRGRIAVVVGSRGISRIDETTKAVIDVLKARGLEPFVVPGMGSHGGATAEGQKEVLESLGVTEARVGAP